MKQAAKKTLAIGSFEEAERFHAERMAGLTPAQRVKVVCSMNAIARRAAAWRAQHGGRTAEDGGLTWKLSVNGSELLGQAK